ncbi:hypothetical protein CRX22_10665 [Salmonella enterica subsp. enterica serovar Newport]|nr:hypothetical protein [Salmonella enterica subsp. enterica serovar Newport]
MIPYNPEDLKAVRFHGRLIYVLQYPEWNEEGVVINHILDQLGFQDWKEDLLLKTIYDTKFLAQVVHVEDQGTTHELVVIPITKFNAWLFALKIPKSMGDMYFSQEVVTEDGEIQVERVNVKENLKRYQAECCAVLYSYWKNGIAINPNAGQPFAGLTSLWRPARQNLDKVIPMFTEYAERMGEDLDSKTMRRAIRIMLTEFLPPALVMKPEESQDGFGLYSLALAEDYVARYLQQAMEDELSPTQVITTLDADMVVAFHSVASGLLAAVNDWQLSIPSKKSV